ncbi:MAG: hypothetical protein IPO48_17825 [Saprospiraceae bacterium]|nr:hypothetical protein [Saprospiraceae bacterium]
MTAALTPSAIAGCDASADVSVLIYSSEPVLTAPANTCNAAFVLPVVTPVVGFTVQYSINGGAWATAPTIPTTPGCHTIAARYVNTAACGLTAALTPSAIAGCNASADVSVLIYPSEPVLTAPANTCNAAFVLPAVTPVVGFTVQYSINGGAWATAPTIPTTPGCHTIAARYVNTAACGLTAALTPSAIAGCDASADVTVLIYPSEPVLTAPANTCNAAFVLPAVTPVVGFTVQYSINGGAWATAPAIPTTPGCHTIAARYVNTAACGLTAALTPSAIAGCDASADVSVLIYPSEPVLIAPTNTCNAAFVLPIVTPVVGFTVQYSINGGAWATAPAIPTTPGCHTIAARYVNTAACGLTAALTPSAIAGCDASADVSVLIYPSEPVLTAPANTCNSAFVLPAVTPIIGFTVQYSINGGAWATAPAIPTTPGCHTIAARYVNTAACGLTAALTPSAIAGCDASADVSVLIYPSEPVLTAPANTCNTAFVLPAVTPVVGFTVQYSINGGAWATAPTIPTTPGCHTIAARYVNTAACGLTAALTPSAIAGCDASADVSVLIYPSEPVLTAPTNTCNAAFVLPIVTPVVGFTVQYSINGGAWATAPTIPTTPGCHTIAARYVNTAACGLTAALTPSAIAGCDASADVSVLIYPSEPVLTAPTNTCNAAFVLPVVTPVVGFTVQYSINSGAWATAPTIPTTPGCHTIAARYVNTAACGLTAALTPSAIAGCDASADVSVLIYPSEPVLTAPANTCNAAFVLPAVTPVVGFTVQYSINGGAWATAPTIPTTPGCHTIAARYVNTAACGLTAALTPSAIAGCDASAMVSVVIFPSAPVITMPRASCMSDFILPAVPPVAGFSIQYSINGGAWTANPMTSMVPGCYSIQARYVLETACGTTLAGTAGTGSCGASNMVNTNVYPVPVVEPVADVFMCDMSQVNVTFSSLTEILSCYGNASIQYQWTNNNTSIGLAASGTGNISFMATQPGTAFIIVTPVFTGPDGSCKGQPISFIISIHQETSIVCNDRVHVSLDENCEFNMSGDFILEGSYNEYFYNVVIKTSTGEIIDNSNVTLHIGEVLIAEVTDICNGNRCWGEVIFEDKLAPVVECNCSGPSEDCTFNCFDLAVIQNETVPMLYGVSPNKSVLTTPPTATDGCGPVSATFTDTINGGDQCDTRELVRSWTFEDASGNKSYCTQRFAFEPISVTDLIPPVREVHLTCGLDATPAAIAGYLDVDSRTQPASATNIGAYADDYAQTGSVVEFNEGYSYGYFTYQLGYAAPAGA